jgi:uncharacterized membrane protein
MLIKTGIYLLIIDMLFLYFASGFFTNQIKLIQNDNIEINILSLILCYCLLIFGLNHFIIKEQKSYIDAFLFGLIIYGVYETTNKASLKNWEWNTVMIDTIWGGTLCVIVKYLCDNF